MTNSINLTVADTKSRFVEKTNHYNYGEAINLMQLKCFKVAWKYGYKTYYQVNAGVGQLLTIQEK